jgi:UDP-2-acetamido-3-amino-2,3-dideoxy-glucuronate N-acetyltransferase
MLSPGKEPLPSVTSAGSRRSWDGVFRAGNRGLNPSREDLHMTAVNMGQYCVIFPDVSIGETTRVGNFVLIRSNTVIGEGCVIGSYVDIEGEVVIGSRVSLQSGVYITRGVIVEDDVFCGPRVITMNDKRIVYRRPNLAWERAAPRILRAARVGGGCVLMPGVTIGENALIGSGSVVTKDVPDRAIALGNPARVVGVVPDDELI